MNILFGIIDVQAEIIARQDKIERRGGQFSEADLGAGDLPLQLLHRIIQESRHKGVYQDFDLGLRPEDGKQLFIVHLGQFDDMGQGAIFSVSVFAQEPDWSY